ncbi:flagellar basal body L-ring protein FlgH [Massilia sp. Se16.2.3]|uniref:flagellar basal body L-ring protein FlgH n=1 Tax=Massilia sp. Se16.2.3 TaxID=2709303 RepID=UPI0016000351|nr:flagellar basal body L-ring protein FlgH [Massilia sp. Se16.2.3]QNB00981.1 flagellar basal body L-ring protein FlgH [Massilia sp. Se16.2.3]
MKKLAFLVLPAMLAACGTTPSSIVPETRSARPALAEVAPPADGAIYNAASYRPMFEDRRARHIGDLLTINIVEKTSANKAGASSGNKAGSASFGLPGVIQSKLGANVALEGATKFNDGDNQSASNAFTGTIGVTVTEVLSNGNLIVAGEKQIAMNKGVEFIRFSGLVSPDNIQAGNVVSSSVVADARVEYRTNSRIDRAEVDSMMSRFFQSMLPF